MRPLEEISAGFDGPLADAAELALSCYRPEEVAAFVADLHRIRGRLDAIVIAASTAADEAGVAKALGQRSLPAAIAGAGNINPRIVGRDLAMGRWLQAFPIVAAAFAEGRIGRGHLEVLRDADNPRSRAYLLDGQEHLVAAGETCSYLDFTQVVAEWVMRADPDGEEPKENEQRRRCSINKQSDGTVAGSFRFDPITGEGVFNAIEREYQRLLADDRASNDPARVMRTETQRRADAVANLILRGVGRTDRVIPAPLIHLVVGLPVAEDLLRRQPGETIPTDRDDPNRRCELADGTPVHPTVAAGLLGAAVLRRLVPDAESDNIDLGRAVRNFPAKLKQALIAATRGRCQHPGCDAKIAWLETDHIHPRARNGTTDLRNAQLLCSYHNKRKRDQLPAAAPEPGPDRGDDSGPPADPNPDSGPDPDAGSDPGPPPAPDPDPYPDPNPDPDRDLG
ncbi:MAG: DUF222 domain-containing protein [Acidimicrobiales bacterium]